MAGNDYQAKMIQRLLEAQTLTHVSAAAVGAVAAGVPVAFALTNTAAGDANAEVIPDRDVLLDTLSFAITGGAGGVASLNFVLSRDAAGTQIVCPQQTGIAIRFQAGSTAVGSVVAQLGGTPYQKFEGIGTSGTLYCIVDVNVGSANILPRLTWRGVYGAQSVYGVATG